MSLYLKPEPASIEVTDEGAYSKFNLVKASRRDLDLVAMQAVILKYQPLFDDPSYVEELADAALGVEPIDR